MSSHDPSASTAPAPSHPAIRVSLTRSQDAIPPSSSGHQLPAAAPLLEVASLLEKCGGNIETLEVADLRLLSPARYMELLDLLKQRAVTLEAEIEKTAGIGEGHNEISR